MILKLDIKLRTLTPTRPPSANTDPWVSQTFYNPAKTFSQIVLVKDHIVYY
jgi:hypothetical protein